MNERDFTYWLKGFFEMAKPQSLTEEQVKMIKEHLDKVVPYKAPQSPFPSISGPLKLPSLSDTIIC